MILGNKKTPKNPKYFCENCCFETNNKKDFDRHLLTLKHMSHAERKHEGNIENPIIINGLKCQICLKEYKNRSSLWKHKKLCMKEDQQHENKDLTSEPTHRQRREFTPELFMEVLKQSKELQNVLIEQNEKLQTKLLEKTDEFQSTLKEQNSKIMELAQKQSVVNNTEANEKFTELALVALGGRGEEQENKFRDKIIRNVLKEVVLTNNYKN